MSNRDWCEEHGENYDEMNAPIICLDCGQRFESDEVDDKGICNHCNDTDDSTKNLKFVLHKLVST